MNGAISNKSYLTRTFTKESIKTIVLWRMIPYLDAPDNTLNGD